VAVAVAVAMAMAIVRVDVKTLVALNDLVVDSPS
jgi:hypothetical protein